MTYPTPRVLDGKWVVDLRTWGFPSSKYVLGPATLSEVEALHLAYAKLEELRAELRASVMRPGAQIALQPRSAAPELFGGAIDAWLRTKVWKSDGGRQWGVKYTRIVRREFGAVVLADLCLPGGEEILTGYLRRCEAAGLAARSIWSRFWVVRQSLKYAAGLEERCWIPYVPALPAMPERPAPRFDWLGEAEFRAGRARLYARTSPGHLRRLIGGGDPALYVERRRVYLSWSFYTGQRQEDVDRLTGNQAGLDVETYVAYGRKTRAAKKQWEMPEPLILDLRAYLAHVGREHFLRNEPIGGGPWQTCGETLTRLFGEAMGPRILRRSYARCMFQCGYEPKEVAERMMHVDLKMLQEIYAETPRPAGHVRSRWRATVPHAPAAKGPKVIPLRAGAAGAVDGERKEE